MASQEQISLLIDRINDKWDNPQARNGLFRNMLKSISIEGIRGISACIEFTWPITAIAGTNGSGKTTFLQLCSAAYVSYEGKRQYKIGDWVRSALAEKTPAFGETSSVQFSFWDDHPTVSIPYLKERKRWGYPRRNNPIRNIEFFGIATFAPRIERKDRLHVFRSKLEVKKTTIFTPEILQSISTVLGVSYPEGKQHTVGLPIGVWSDSLPQVKRGVHTYAEPHMGAGEQKVIRLIQELEAVPKNSLILLEEPEITLHSDAQRGLAWYLMSLCLRNGHQILIATHSTDLFESLPSGARTLLIRNNQGVRVIPHTPYIAVARELSVVAKTNKDLVLVEDIVAQEFLNEILRCQNKQLLDNCSIVPVGNTDDVYRLVKAFRKDGVRAIGVRDPDIGDAPTDWIFSLPGNTALECLLLTADNVTATECVLNGITNAYDKAKIAGLNHSGSKWGKAVLDALAIETGVTKAKLTDRLTISWIRSHSEETKALVDQLVLGLLK
ncbi:ATP-dependent nuclease [Chitinimonas sp. PSY-7]|uniref:AAA family ATPase n=1 Tax=Chitinimonas sp. PSY-7 TaxID=3459088 RepID=UPI00403FEF85